MHSRIVLYVAFIAAAAFPVISAPVAGDQVIPLNQTEPVGQTGPSNVLASNKTILVYPAAPLNPTPPNQAVPLDLGALLNQTAQVKTGSDFLDGFLSALGGEISQGLSSILQGLLSGSQPLGFPLLATTNSNQSGLSPPEKRQLGELLGIFLTSEDAAELLSKQPVKRAILPAPIPPRVPSC